MINNLARLLIQRFSRTAACIVIALPISADAGRAQAGETCTYTIKGKTSYTFSCRWLINGETKKTIFVDNHETGDRYVVEKSEWVIGPTSNCISRYAAKVCTKQWW